MGAAVGAVLVFSSPPHFPHYIHSGNPTHGTMPPAEGVFPLLNLLETPLQTHLYVFLLGYSKYCRLTMRINHLHGIWGQTLPWFPGLPSSDLPACTRRYGSRSQAGPRRCFLYILPAQVDPQ